MSIGSPPCSPDASFACDDEREHMRHGRVRRTSARWLYAPSVKQDMRRCACEAPLAHVKPVPIHARRFRLAHSMCADNCR
eukprot:scaffold271857_cov40-Tisochrysis_lutea.AAC.3